MPHVMTLEGADLGAGNGNAGPPVVYFPQAGSPLAPHQAIVGPTRVAPIVYGPGGTPVMYRRRYPARGPVCEYCDPDYFTVMDGGQHMIPYRQQFSGAAEAFLFQQKPGVANSIVIGGAILTGVLLSGLGVWMYHKVGYKPKRASAETGWGETGWSMEW